jgi:hypothetical protein
MNPKLNLTAAEPGAATDCLQLRSFLTTLPAAAELGRCNGALGLDAPSHESQYS